VKCVSLTDVGFGHHLKGTMGVTSNNTLAVVEKFRQRYDDVMHDDGLASNRAACNQSYGITMNWRFRLTICTRIAAYVQTGVQTGVRDTAGTCTAK